MTNRTMVFGDDGSISADLAWLWINVHAWTDWELDIVHAVPPVAVVASAEPIELHEWNPGNPRVPFAEAKLARVVHLTGELDPRLALSRESDLLVVGPRGPGLAKAMHLGSTAEWLMVHPPSPMVVARHGRRTQTAVVCHDGSPHAAAAMAALCALPWAHQLAATLVVVDDGRTDVDATVTAATAALLSTGATVEHRIPSGDPTHEILRFLETHTPDLLVCGTRGLTGIKRLRVGSTAAVLAHAATSSILVACDPLADA